MGHAHTHRSQFAKERHERIKAGEVTKLVSNTWDANDTAEDGSPVFRVADYRARRSGLDAQLLATVVRALSVAPKSRTESTLAMLQPLCERVPFLRLLSEEERTALFRIATVMSLRRGQELWREGAEAEAFYILLDGGVNETRMESKQVGRMRGLAAAVGVKHAVNVRVVKELDSFGRVVRGVEGVVMNRTTTATAQTDSVVVCVSQRDYDDELAAYNAAKRAEDIAFLHRVSLFRHWTRDRLAAVSAVSRQVRLPSGALVYKQGSKAPDFYIVRLGQVRLLREVNDDRVAPRVVLREALRRSGVAGGARDGGSLFDALGATRGMPPDGAMKRSGSEPPSRSAGGTVVAASKTAAKTASMPPAMPEGRRSGVAARRGGGVQLLRLGSAALRSAPSTASNASATQFDFTGVATPQSGITTPGTRSGVRRGNVMASMSLAHELVALQAKRFIECEQLEPRGFFGEIESVKQLPLSLNTVECMTNVTLMVIPANEFRNLMRMYPSLKRDIQGYMDQRSRPDEVYTRIARESELWTAYKKEVTSIIHRPARDPSARTQAVNRDPPLPTEPSRDVVGVVADEVDWSGRLSPDRKRAGRRRDRGTAERPALRHSAEALERMKSNEPRAPEAGLVAIRQRRMNVEAAARAKENRGLARLRSRAKGRGGRLFGLSAHFVKEETLSTTSGSSPPRSSPPPGTVYSRTSRSISRSPSPSRSPGTPAASLARRTAGSPSTLGRGATPPRPPMSALRGHTREEDGGDDDLSDVSDSFDAVARARRTRVLELPVFALADKTLAKRADDWRAATRRPRPGGASSRAFTAPTHGAGGGMAGTPAMMHGGGTVAFPSPPGSLGGSDAGAAPQGLGVARLPLMSPVAAKKPRPIRAGRPSGGTLTFGAAFKETVGVPQLDENMGPLGFASPLQVRPPVSAPGGPGSGSRGDSWGGAAHDLGSGRAPVGSGTGSGFSSRSASSSSTGAG